MTQEFFKWVLIQPVSKLRIEGVWSLSELLCFNLKCLAWSSHVRVPSLADIVGSQTWTWLIYYRESESFSGWIVEYQMFKFGKKKRGTRPDWPSCYCSPRDAPCWDAPRQFIYLPALELRAQSVQHCCILPLYPALQWRHLVWLRIDWVPSSVVSSVKGQVVEWYCFFTYTI